MRHSCIFATASLLVTGLVGCGMESTGSTTINPAQDVDLTFSTFNLTNTETVPDNLDHTRFWDFYRGIEPTGSDSEDQQTVAEIRSHVDIFIGATPSDDGTHYVTVRNPLDLMNQVIAYGNVDNFDEGRRYIRQRIADSEAGTYNSRSNGAQIRFTDQAATLDAAPLNERIWMYPTLDWRYLPQGVEGSGLTEKVYRTIQYVSRSVNDAGKEDQPELLSVLAGSRFDGNEFVALGYNAPEYATADYLSRNHGSVELRQDYVDNVDTLFIKSPDQTVLTLGGYSGYSDSDESPDCLRVEMDYPALKVRIFTSNGEPSRIDDPNSDVDGDTIPNPAYCANQETGDEVTAWNAESVSKRQ